MGNDKYGKYGKIWNILLDMAICSAIMGNENGENGDSWRDMAISKSK